MDQTDLEAQSQTRKSRRGRHASSYWPPWASRLPADGTSASDSYWKPSPRPTHSVSQSHEQRRPDYGVTEPVTSCYSASNTYKPKHRAPTSVSPKAPPHIPTSDQSYRPPQHSSRTTRNKLLTTNNVAVVRKACYKDDAEEDDEVKYDEEDVNYVEENVEDEVAGEVDEDQDETYEYNDKDYEEQEADDEVDDESDAFQTQLHRMQHKVQKASNLRTQNLRHAEQQQDLRKIQHQQHIHKMYQDQKLPRFYSQVAEPQQQIAHDTSYGDVIDAISDDQHTPPWTPDLRKSSRRMSETHHTVPAWVQTRKSVERNRDRFNSALATAQEQQRLQRQHQQQQQQPQHHQHQHQHLRRHRTMKPEIESLMMPQPANPIAKKCCICEGSTAPVTMRVGSTEKGNCRLHEYRGFTVRGPPGEDGEAEEQVVCGRCAKRHNMEDLRSGCETSSPEAPVHLYATKPHRSRIHHRSPTYDCPEDNQAIDEMLAAYTSSQPRASTLDYAVAPKGRTRHSVQSARSPLRRSNYFEH